MPYEEVVKGYEVGEGEYVVLDEGRDRGCRRRPRARHRRSRRSSRPRRSTRSSTRRPTTSARARRAATRTGCCTTRSSGPAAPASAGSPSTTASTSPPSARSTACSRCTRCASPTSRARRTTSSSRRRAASRAERRSRWPPSSSSRSTSDFDPSKRKDEYREAVLDMIERKAAGKKPRKPKEKPPEEAPDLMAALEASLGEEADGPPALDRIAELRPRQRPRRALQRRARPRPALPPAAREGRRADRDAPLLRRGGRGGAARGDRPRLRPRERQDGRRHRRGPRGGRAAQDAHDRHRGVRRPRRRSTRSTSTTRTSSPRPATPRARGAPTSCSSRRWAASERVALGRFVMRTKEYLVAIRVRDERLVAHHDAVRRRDPPDQGHRHGGRQEAGEGAARPGRRADRGALGRLGPGATGGPLPRRLEDVIERKKKGKTITAPKAGARSRRPCPTSWPRSSAASPRRRARSRPSDDGDGDGGARRAEPRGAVREAQEEDVPAARR